MRFVSFALATLLFAAPADVPKPTFSSWRAEMRKALYVPEKLPPLEAKVWSSFSPMPGVIADRVTYRTLDGMLVPAIVYRPEKPKGKLPGIVVVNGHGGDKYSWYAFYSGMMFAQAGAEVVTYDPIGEGERNIDRKSRASSHDRIIPVPEGVNPDDPGQHLAGLMQVDLMQGVSYLQQRPEVDPKRIAVVGYSMGAFVTGIAGALDPRIHAVLLSGGGTFDDEADGGKSFDTGKLPCQAAPWHALKVLGGEFHERGAVLYALNAERGPMLVENGSMDTVMDIPHRTPEWFAAMRDLAMKTYLAAGGNPARGAADMFTTHVDEGKSHRTAWVERYAVTWLNDQIHFANWTDAEIAKMPTTHIADWIAAQNIPWSISNGYMRDDREGGLDALGTGLPGIPRDQLNVLPEADWQRLKGELIYDCWAEKIVAGEQKIASGRETFTTVSH
jgi:dienelactone hydrolase